MAATIMRSQSPLNQDRRATRRKPCYERSLKSSVGISRSYLWMNQGVRKASDRVLARRIPKSPCRGHPYFLKSAYGASQSTTTSIQNSGLVTYLAPVFPNRETASMWQVSRRASGRDACQSHLAHRNLSSCEWSIRGCRPFAGGTNGCHAIRGNAPLR